MYCCVVSNSYCIILKIRIQQGLNSNTHAVLCHVLLTSLSGCWVHCNDARIKYCSSDEVAQSQAYILFYIRRHGITSDASTHVIPTTPITPFLTPVPCNKRRKLE